MIDLVGQGYSFDEFLLRDYIEIPKNGKEHIELFDILCYNFGENNLMEITSLSIGFLRHRLLVALGSHFCYYL